MPDRGWSRSMFEVQCVQFGDWLAGAQQGGLLPLSSGFRDVRPDVDDETLRDITTHLQGLGHLIVSPRYARGLIVSTRLSDVGLAELRRRGDRRQDKRVRRVACRDAVLDWLDDQEVEPADITRMRDDPRCFFEGEPFRDEEVHRAAADLRERGLIAGLNVWGPELPRPHVTEDGRACVEQFDGSVVAWGQRGHQPVGDSYVTNVQHNAGMVGQGRHVEQTQHRGIDPAQLRDVLEAIREAATDLDDDDREDVEDHLRALGDDAAGPSPDQTVVKRRVTRMQRLAGRIGNPALTTAMTVETTRLLQHLDWI